MTHVSLRLRPQEKFPREDLTEVNAEILSLMLLNKQLVTNGHTTAEQVYPIFIGTHQPLAIASENLFDDEDKTRAVDFGIRAFEAITLFVAADTPKPSLDTLPVNINGIIKPANVRSVREYFAHANHAFISFMPQTANVIRETSQRFVGSAALAVLGGAIARQFELDNVED